MRERSGDLRTHFVQAACLLVCAIVHVFACGQG